MWNNCSGWVVKKMEGILKKSLFTGRPVVMMYCSKKGMITKRIVSVETVQDNWIGGFCHLRKSYRRFQKENILAILPVEERDLLQVERYTPA